MKFTFINHWRDAVVTNIRKPAARSPRMCIDCDSSQCHLVLLHQYQKLLKPLVRCGTVRYGTVRYEHPNTRKCLLQSAIVYTDWHWSVVMFSSLTLQNYYDPKFRHHTNKSHSLKSALCQLYRNCIVTGSTVVLTSTWVLRCQPLLLLLLTCSRVHSASSPVDTDAFFFAVNRRERKADH